MRIANKMRYTLENEGFEIKIQNGSIIINKGKETMLEIYCWRQRVIIRKQGHTKKYDELMGIWANLGKICVKVRKGNKFFSIEI